MTNVNVPLSFTPVSQSDVYTSHVPSAFDWKHYAESANHLNGRGSQLIPVSMLSTSSLTANTTYTYEVAVFPRPQALERVWDIVGHWTLWLSASSTTMMSLTGSGHLSTAVSGWIAGGPGGVVDRLQLIESVHPSTSGAVAFLGLTSSTGPVGTSYIEQLSIWEMPRASLSLSRSVDAGVADDFGVRTPIWADSSVPFSDFSNVRGVTLSMSSAIGNARRAGQWYYTSPVRSGGTVKFGEKTGQLQGTSGGGRQYFSPMSSSIQTRRIANSTTAEVDIYVLAAVNQNSQTVTVDFESDEGTESIVCAPAAANTPEWFSGTLLVRSDGTDDSTSGEPSGGTCRFNFSWTTTSTQAEIYSVCIGEKHKDY